MFFNRLGRQAPEGGYSALRSKKRKLFCAVGHDGRVIGTDNADDCPNDDNRAATVYKAFEVK